MQVASLQDRGHHTLSCCSAQGSHRERHNHKRFHHHICFECISLGSQVSSSNSDVDVRQLTLVSTYHNVFEKHHRFIGWLGLAVRILSQNSLKVYD